jgi:hypothetical protein
MRVEFSPFRSPRLDPLEPDGVELKSGGAGRTPNSVALQVVPSAGDLKSGAISLARYDIEQIGIDHPALLTGNLEACAVARCRRSGPFPWHFTIDCRSLPRNGTKAETCDLAWGSALEGQADKAEKTYQANRLTEDAAIGVCAATFASLAEGEITEVTLHGTGVDYWVDRRRAVLEVSGIASGDAARLAARHRLKVQQAERGSLFQGGYDAYVFVIHFGGRESILSHHVSRGPQDGVPTSSPRQQDAGPTN